MTTKFRSIFGTVPERLFRDTRGVVLILVALLLPVLVGLTGLGVETGLWYAIKRQNQAAADEAAISGAMEVAAAKPDVTGQALCTARWNGFGSSVALPPPCPNALNGATVNNPPTSGRYSGNDSYVEVILSHEQSTLFANINPINLANVTIKTRAVAGPPVLGTGCILALDPQADSAISLSNNATLANTDCGVVADSNSASALNLSNNAVIDGPVSVVGNWSLSNGAQLNGNPNVNGGALIADPYSGLSIPMPLPGCTGQAHIRGNNQPPLNLNPGHFCSGWSFGNSDIINLSPGTYYIDSQLSIGNSATINGAGGVTLVVDTGNAGFAVSIGNNATLNLVAPGPGAGQPFPGVALMDLSTANNGNVTQNLNNNSVSFNLKGAIYFRNQILNFSNNVSLAGGCTQIIARIINLSNNVNIDDNCAGVGITPISIVGNSIVVVE